MRHEIDITDLFDKLPPKTKRELMKLVRSVVEKTEESSIEHIKAFVDQYSDSSQIDRMVANIASNVIKKVGRDLTKAVKESKDGLSGIKAGYITLECLKHECDSLLKALTEIEEEEKEHSCSSH